MIRFALLAGVGLLGMALMVWSSFWEAGAPAATRLAPRQLPAGPPLALALAREQAVYQRDVELQLEAYGQRLARLRQEAQAATPAAREALLLETTIAQLEDGLRQAEATLTALRQSGEGVWLTRRIAMEEALQALHQAFIQRAGALPPAATERLG